MKKKFLGEERKNMLFLRFDFSDLYPSNTQTRIFFLAYIRVLGLWNNAMNFCPVSNTVVQ